MSDERFGLDGGFSEGEISETLDAVRTALRISQTKLYDPELMIYVNSVHEDLKNVGIRADTLSLYDFKSACIAYSKSLFGSTGVSDKEVWANIYKDLLLRFKLRGDSDRPER